jgi:pimeloyl-ACP methyl ester carboxylesterase
MRRAGAVARLVAVALVAAVLAGCTGDDDVRPEGTRSSSSSAAAPTDATAPEPAARTGPLARFYEQRLRWTACHGGFRCAPLEVPLDYGDPAGPAIELAVVRLPRSGDGPRRSLVLNPGGPGGSGVDYALAADSVVSGDVRRRYDVVGFDPRGVQRSAPVSCLSDAALDVFVSIDGSPDTADEEQALQQEWSGLGAGCIDRMPAVSAHVSTVEAVRDLDVLRAALGDRRLTYLGKSYGTYLGTTYAERFPNRVGRLVLDGQVDPAASAADIADGQVTGFQRALDAFLRNCVQRSGCPLDGDAAAAGEQLGRLVDRTDAQPLRGEDRREVTQALVIYGIAAALYDEGTWPLLRQGIAEMRRGSGATLLSLADFYSDRGPDGHYTTNGLEAFYAISCLDRAETRSLEEQRAQARELDARSPVFGSFIAWGNLPCLGWPVPSTTEPAPASAAGARPILVVGTTRDPATPYEWSRTVAGTLERGRLLTYVGDGHTAYRRGNGCIDEAVDRYLLEGALPAEGTRCG